MKNIEKIISKRAGNTDLIAIENKMIEVLESTHFVFVLMNGMMIEENIDKIQRI